MERHFILPISLAAALHVGLLYGIRPAALVKHLNSNEETTVYEYVLPKDVDPPQPIDPEEQAASKGSPEPAPPVGPELPAIGPHEFEIPVPFRPMSDKIDFPRIPSEPPGIPEGTADALRKGIAGIGELDDPPRARAQIAPQYPFEPRRRGQTGEVVVEFVVDKTGHVSAPRVVRSSDPAFDEPTLRAVLKWRFEPGRRHGEIVSFRMSVPVVFSLNEG